MPPTVTINAIERVNPGLFIRMADFGSDSPALVVDDSMEPTATFDDEEYVLLAQMCSIMSVYWLQDSSRKLLRNLSADLQRQAAITVYGNQTPDAQYDYARSQLGFSASTVDAVRALAQKSQQATKKVLLFSDVHVSAATIGPNGIVYFDPETGDASTVDVDEFSIYVGQARRALVG